jgi:hypothetical protein
VVVGWLDQSFLYTASTVRNEENFDFLQKKNFSSQSNLELLHACAYHIGFHQWVKDSLECYISVPFFLLHFQCYGTKKMSSEKRDGYGIPERCCQSHLWGQVQNQLNICYIVLISYHLVTEVSEFLNYA